MIAAIASLLRGGKYVHEVHGTATAGTGAGRAAAAGAVPAASLPAGS